jgi:hypothetical protein
LQPYQSACAVLTIRGPSAGPNGILRRTRKTNSIVVLRGLDPRTHVFFRPPQGMGGRVKPGQDEIGAIFFSSAKFSPDRRRL